MAEKPQSNPLIYEKISKVMGLVGVIGKDKKNLQQGYMFRGIDDMYNALNKHLSDEKVFFTSEVLETIREERSSKTGGMLMYSIIKMKFKAFAQDGSFVESTTVGEAMDSGDKSMNKAMSTAYKYALMQIFCIPTNEEKDTEHVTHEVKAKPKEQKPTISKEEQIHLFNTHKKNLEDCKTTEELKAAYTNAYNDRVLLGENFEKIKSLKDTLKENLPATPQPAEAETPEKIDKPKTLKVMKVSDVDELYKDIEAGLIPITILTDVIKAAKDRFIVSESIQSEIVRRYNK